MTMHVFSSLWFVFKGFFDQTKICFLMKILNRGKGVSDSEKSAFLRQIVIALNYDLFSNKMQA
jgi:hypothetical protein